MRNSKKLGNQSVLLQKAGIIERKITKMFVVKKKKRKKFRICKLLIGK